jgi:hypothetical protein
MQMYAHTDEEWESLPHIHLTGPNRWDPDVLDYNLSSRDDWYNEVKQMDKDEQDSDFDQTGEYLHRESITTPMEIPDEDPSETKEDDVEEIVAMPADMERTQTDDDDDSSCGPMPGLEPQDDLYDSSDSESKEEPIKSRRAFRYAVASAVLQDIPELDSDDSSDEGSYYQSDSDDESEVSVDDMENLDQEAAEEEEESPVQVRISSTEHSKET